MIQPRIVKIQPVDLPPVKNRKGRVTFAGVPTVGLLPKNGGWQVQTRSGEDTDDWTDVQDGWFKKRSEAEEQAPILCHF